MAAQYELLSQLLKSGGRLDMGQELFYKFYQAFVLKDRWLQYIGGVGTTLLVTAIALAMGVLLGSVVALVRVAHDQQRPGRSNPVLGVFNAVCQVYTTVIVGALALGINSGAYVSEIIRGGLMAVDPGQMEAGRSLGLNYITTMVVIIIPQAIRAVLPALCPGQRVHHAAEGYLPYHRHRRQGAAVCGPGHHEPHLRGHVPPVWRGTDLSGAGDDLYLAACKI